MLASSLTASLRLRICKSCMSFCEMTVTDAGVCSSGASAKPPTEARLAAGTLLAVTTTSAMLGVSAGASALSFAARAGAANACRMARVKTEIDKFGVDIDCSWFKPSLGKEHGRLLVRLAPTQELSKEGGTLRFPSLALSRSGTKGISHPDDCSRTPSEMTA